MRITDLVGGAIVTVTVGCVTAVVGTAGWLAMPAIRAQMGLAPPPVQSYAVGTRIDVPPSVYEASSYTVVLFAESNCGVCQRVTPWLSRVLDQFRQRPGMHLVMVTADGHMTDELQYAEHLGLEKGSVVPLDLRSLHVRLVPTLVVVDRRGMVRYSQEGAPSSEPEATLAALQSVMQER
jgi:hypothetical protein